MPPRRGLGSGPVHDPQKSIQYTLNLVRPHSELKWTLHSSKWSHNNGGWDIKDSATVVLRRATASTLASASLSPRRSRDASSATFPAMLNQFKKRAEQLFPK